MKRCYRCKETKPEEAFYKNKAKPDGINTECKSCSRARVDEHNEANPGAAGLRARKSHLKNLYGMTQAEYATILTKQGGGCAICGSPTARRTGNLNFIVDHEHATGVVRGLLCHPCNSGVGLLQDSPDTLASAIRYLQSHGKPLSEISLGARSAAPNIHYSGDRDSGKAN